MDCETMVLYERIDNGRLPSQVRRGVIFSEFGMKSEEFSVIFQNMWHIEVL